MLRDGLDRVSAATFGRLGSKDVTNAHKEMDALTHDVIPDAVTTAIKSQGSWTPPGPSG